MRSIFSRRGWRRSGSWRRSWTARRSWCRLTTPNCSAIGGMRGRSSSISLCARRYYDQQVFALITPGGLLRRHPTHQVATPGRVKLGRGRLLERVWLNETNQWIYPHLHVAQERMTGAGAALPAADAAAGAGTAAGCARTAAGPGQRLAVHPAHRHQPGLCAQARDGSPAALHEVARAVDGWRGGRALAGGDRIAGQHFSRGGSPVLGIAGGGVSTEVRRRRCIKRKGHPRGCPF